MEIPGHAGQSLAASLELPAGTPRSFAIMAHCFTCTSDTHATARISAALAERGYAVLRFDFTGLGRSAGDFAETTFTTNVGDLVAAAAWLAEHHGEVELLVGHSLGGSAVIAAAGQIPTVKAVATIGAPACPDHVRHLFSAPVDAAGRGPRAVSIGGRAFTVGQDFLDDIALQPQTERLRRLRAALLVLHSPIDQVVGIDNAREIFDAARHPKSFVSLDGADHLLSDQRDAWFAADIIAAWASRYLTDPAGGPADQGPVDDRPEGVLVRELSPTGYAHVASIPGHTWHLDEPVTSGGTDTGPNPYAAMLAALGGCTSMTMRMYAARKGWDYGTTTVRLVHTRVNARDCDDCGDGEGLVDRIERVIDLDPGLDDDQRAAMLRIADKCPVHRTMAGTARIITRVGEA